MDILHDKTEKIYRQFGDEKVVVGVKNPDLKITLINPRALIFLIFIVLIFFLNFRYIKILNSSTRNIIFIVASIVLVLAILKFLNGSYKIYYEDNNLIFENKLGKKNIFDISKYPRVYISYKIYTTYKQRLELYKEVEVYRLHIEQKDNNIGLNLDSKKIRMLLDNLETKEKYEVDENIWNLSVNDREKTFFDYMDFLKGKQKIIGIKDTSKSMKISKDISIVFKFLICVFIVCSICVINLMIKGDFYIAILLALLLPVLLFVLKEERKEIYLKISYPSENSIKIDKREFYLKNNIMIDLKATQNPKSGKKYDYTLKIFDKINIYKINLNNAKTEEICEIIDNLIFE